METKNLHKSKQARFFAFQIGLGLDFESFLKPITRSSSTNPYSHTGSTMKEKAEKVKAAKVINPEPEPPEQPPTAIVPPPPPPSPIPPINELSENVDERLLGPIYKLGDLGPILIHHGRVTKNLWQVCCNEVAAELTELSSILTKFNLPPVNYCKDKTYFLADYEQAPDLETCKSKDFLDFWVFPILLPAIQSLIQFAKMNRVFQCRHCSLNSMDYIVEYLYNNNPRYPDRLEKPTSLFDIPFVKSWTAIYPRVPIPKWMTMTDKEAAIIIQKAVRGFLVRVRPNIQEMRKFWKNFKKEMEAKKSNSDGEEDQLTPVDSELFGGSETQDIGGENQPYFHSEACLLCIRFKDYLDHHPVYQALLNDQQIEAPTGAESAEESVLHNEEDLEGEDETIAVHSSRASHPLTQLPSGDTQATSHSSKSNKMRLSVASSGGGKSNKMRLSLASSGGAKPTKGRKSQFPL